MSATGPSVRPSSSSISENYYRIWSERKRKKEEDFSPRLVGRGLFPPDIARDRDMHHFKDMIMPEGKEEKYCFFFSSAFVNAEQEVRERERERKAESEKPISVWDSTFPSRLLQCRYIRGRPGANEREKKNSCYRCKKTFFSSLPLASSCSSVTSWKTQGRKCVRVC